MFFFKQKTAYEMRISDWSSDVCSSDLFRERQEGQRERPRYPDQRFDDGEDDGGDDLRDDREEDATAPISISGLPPAIGSAASDDSSDRDRRHEAGDGDEDRKSTRLNSSH